MFGNVFHLERLNACLVIGMCLLVAGHTVTAIDLGGGLKAQAPGDSAAYVGESFRESFRESGSGGQAFGALNVIGSASVQTYFQIVELTAYEQLMLELVNRARANPGAEASRLGIDLNEDLAPGTIEDSPKQPLASHAQLLDAARDHSQWMLDSDTFSHTGVGGSSPTDRIAAASYPLSAGSGTGENISIGLASGEVDPLGGTIDRHEGLFLSSGHRENICAGLFDEVGLGIQIGMFTSNQQDSNAMTATQNFAYSGGTPGPLLTGVAFYDFNGNSFYDPGESISGLSVDLSGGDYYTQTATAGGYALPYPLGSETRTVSFTDAVGTRDFQVSLNGSLNEKFDLMPAYEAPELQGSEAPVIGSANNYAVAATFGATGYRVDLESWEAVGSDSPTDLSLVMDATSGDYSALSNTVKYSGAASYHLAQPSFTTEYLQYQSSFEVEAGASLNFRSRLGWATANQTAEVWVSLDEGLNWQAVYSQPGNGSSGETSFAARSVSLAAFDGERILLRFAYVYSGSGSAFTQTSDGVGWYIDEVQFQGLLEVEVLASDSILPGASYIFNPDSGAKRYLTARPIHDSAYWPSGNSLELNPVVGGELPEITSEPANQQVTEPQGLTFSVLATGAVSYQWQRSSDGGSTWADLDGETGSDLIIGGTDVSMDGGQYRVVVTGNQGAVTSNAAILSVLPPWYSSAADLGAGWRWYAWLGYFNTAQAPWIFHQEHGWLYPFATGPESVYFWDSEMGSILWTSESVFPALYRFSDGKWIFYQKGSSNPRWFVNLLTGQWEQW